MSTTTGIAGRTNYSDWDKKVADLVEQVEEEEQEEQQHAKRVLGLDGKYASSLAEATERQKANDVKQTKKVLEDYKTREGSMMQTFSNVLKEKTNDNDDDDNDKEETKSTEPTVVRLTRNVMEAGKRVVTLCDTTGSSRKDMIVLTQDLSLLESKVSTNTTAGVVPKAYPEDAENQVQEQAPSQQHRTMLGLIKLFIANVHNCTIVIRCKLISGTVEMNHCSNVTVRVEQDATVATLQADLCEHISIEYHDAPSGKNTTNLPAGQPKLYWGHDCEDRIFHAGVTDMRVAVYRDGFVETERTCDYRADGAVAVGNATCEEYQFVTSVVDEVLVTEKVIRHGGTARAMTQRELDREKETRERAATVMMDKAEEMIKIIDKDGNEVMKKEVTTEEVMEEVYASMNKSDIDHIVAECEKNKTRGNEAFAAGEYGQAVLLYSLALDKADELPDRNDDNDVNEATTTKQKQKQLFPRHIVLSNRSAAFLKLGVHDKALADGTRAQELEPTYVKGVFRKGLALHAMGRYKEAIDALAAAHKIEPKNKQIKQALQFSEVRMTQQIRKRMGEQ